MAPEIHRLSPTLAIWHQYDPAVKAELFSTAITTQAGVCLVDPIPLDGEALSDLIGTGKVGAVVVTNANHERAAAAFAADFSVPTYSAENSVPEALGLTAIPLPGAAPREIALHCGADGGTMIVGDALIHFGSHGFSFLPAKYCTNPKLMRKSLQALLDFSFERLLFAHGTPIMAKARERLTALLEN